MINLSTILIQFVLRGGLPLEEHLKKGYGPNGLSVSFHPGYSLDELARHSHFKNGTLSYATVQELVSALAAVGYEMVLTATPSANNPDHHDLAVRRNGIVLPVLPNDAAKALSQALHNIPNPYKAP